MLRVTSISTVRRILPTLWVRSLSTVEVATRCSMLRLVG